MYKKKDKAEDEGKENEEEEGEGQDHKFLSREMKPDLRRQDCYGVFIMSNPLTQSCLLRRPFPKELRNILVTEVPIAWKRLWWLSFVVLR